MNTQLQTLLNTKSPIFLDGAMGTMLMAAGLETGNSPEEWNILHPEKVQAVHRAYIDAGSQIILTNTFGGNSFRLQMHNLEEQVTEFNQAAASNARTEADAAPHPVVVAGSIGPTGELLDPLGTMTFEEAKTAFATQATALAKGGVDILWIETMSDLNEVKAAVEGIRSVCNLPIAATMTFDTHGRTMMGISPSQAIEALKSLNLIAIGANCGTGITEIEAVIEAMHQADPSITLIAKANAGIPRLENGNLVYDGTPALMAEYAKRVHSLGAKLIGGCCGSTPEHIKAMVSILNE